MSIRLAFECDGCNNVADSERLTRHFESLNGKGFGFGSWVMPKITDYTPDGWIAFDPYTGCTYCQDCWQEILAETPRAEES